MAFHLWSRVIDRQSVDAVGTEVGQRTWCCVEQTLPHQHHRLKDHSLANWKLLKCREDRRDVVMTTSAGALHSVPTAGDRDGRRQRQQEVSCNSPAGNSQIPGREQCRLRRQKRRERFPKVVLSNRPLFWTRKGSKLLSTSSRDCQIKPTC